MHNLLKPHWIFICVTIPQLIFLYLFWDAYTLIDSDLEMESIQLWKYYGAGMIILSLLATIYASFLSFRNQKVSTVYAVTSLISFSILMATLVLNAEIMIPRSIPEWMLNSEILYKYALTFYIPACLYSILILVLNSVNPDPDQNNNWKNIIPLILIPGITYLVFAAGIPFVNQRYFGEHTMMIFITFITIIFIFFLLRGLYITSIKRGREWKYANKIWALLLGIILPLLGLYLNNSNFSGSDFINTGEGVFGDFSHPLFYILCIFNGLFLLLPNTKNQASRWAFFIARSLTLPFTLYFCLVFIPMLPLGVMTIVVFGLGLLLLVPLGLTFIHGQSLWKDYQFLKTFYHPLAVKLTFLFAVLAFPLFMFLTFKKDRVQLNKALDYIFEPDFSIEEPNFHTGSIRRVLRAVKTQRSNRRNSIFFGERLTPYLTEWYQNIVFDRMSLSNDKIAKMERILLGNTTIPPTSRVFISSSSDQIKVDTITSTTEYFKEGDYYKTTLDFTITNQTDFMREYATQFELPEDAMISDYYLYVGDKKEPGILSEKRSALWIYRQITSRRKDPGILYYLDGNEVGFRVFPFNNKETRKTGIEIIHKENSTLTIDGIEILLGDPSHTKEQEIIENENFIYVPSTIKNKLNPTLRKPYYHFIVDCSEHKETYQSTYTEKINEIMRMNFLPSQKAKISLLNYDEVLLDHEAGAPIDFSRQAFEGGYFLERALKRAIAKHFTEKEEEYPVFILISSKKIYSSELSSLKNYESFIPDGIHIYSADFNKKELSALGMHYKGDPLYSKHKNVTTSVLTQPSYSIALPPSSSGNLRLKANTFNPDQTLNALNEWEQAMYLKGANLYLKLHPEKTQTHWLSFVKKSFETNIMSPLTSFIVVETEAQRETLKRKQKEVLEGRSTFDLEETPNNSMDEPAFWFLLSFALLLLLWFRKKGIIA